MNEERANGTRALQEDGQITYANEVISTIVTVATTEVEGISGISGGGSISGIIGRGKTPRGVKVDVNGNEVSVDLSVTVDYGIPIQKVGRNCQENVRKSIETMTGMKVLRVDLHVVGVSFDKELQEMQQSQRLAMQVEENSDDKPSADAAMLASDQTGSEQADSEGTTEETAGTNETSEASDLDSEDNSSEEDSAD